jgi:hypothetical protein
MTVGSRQVHTQLHETTAVIDAPLHDWIFILLFPHHLKP